MSAHRLILLAPESVQKTLDVSSRIGVVEISTVAPETECTRPLTSRYWMNCEGTSTDTVPFAFQIASALYPFARVYTQVNVERSAAREHGWLTVTPVSHFSISPYVEPAGLSPPEELQRVPQLGLS